MTRRPASQGQRLARIEAEVIRCVRCPRLVQWREEAAAHPPRRFRGQRYWARPLPAFGDPGARLILVGLAPAAHGGNRTGRIFTGDESGRFLFEALHAVGLANQPISVARDDGLELRGALLTAAVRCAPPDNRPSPAELEACHEYLDRENAVLSGPRVFVALGALAFDACVMVMVRSGEPRPRPRPHFAHGAEVTIGPSRIFASYHPSQQNTFTRRLTQPMLRSVLRSAIRAANEPESPRGGRRSPAV